ncbi:MAG: hypothetical protein WCL39_07215 [Armatimonadota bacterium]
MDAKELRIEPQKSAAVVTELPATQTGLVEAELSPPDALKQDDQAFALVGRPQSARLLLVSPGNVFLEQALALDPQLEVVKATAAPSDKQLNDFDIIVWDRVNSSKPAVAAEWYIKSEGPGAPASLAGQRPPATPIWTPSASISRAADLTDMRYEGFASLQAKPWARPIAEAGGVPLIVSGEDAGVRKISFGWDYMASDLPLRVTFPILVANTISWLLGPRDTSGSYTPGEIVKLQSEGDKPAQITGPEGEMRTLAIGTSDFTDTEQVGIYSWRSGNQGGKFAVNLASAEQSNLAVTGLTQQSSRLGGGSGIPRTNRELYGWLLIVGLAFLSLEWMVFHRRI